MAAAAILAGCSAFDRALLRPLGEGDALMPSVDSGMDAGQQAQLDGSVSAHEASVPDDRDADAAHEAGADAAEDTDGAVIEDAAAEDAAVTDAGAECAAATTTDYCNSVPALAAPPVIDGALDCGLNVMRMPQVGWNGAGAPPEAHRTHVAFAYRPEGLYVFIEVRGRPPAPHPALDAIYCGDAIELYIDADGMLASDGSYDRPGTIQLIAAAPASLAAPNPHFELFAGGLSQGAWTSTERELVWREDGYALEAFIAAADLGLESWALANAIGINVVIDVAGPAGSPDLGCGLQLGQYFWRLSSITPSRCNGEPWCDTRAFCQPSLE